MSVQGEIPVDPIVETFLGYWLARRGGRAMPAWCDIGPTDIPALLPHLAVFRVQPQPLDFYVVLAGEHVVAGYGRSPARQWLSELIAANRSLGILANRFRLCIERRAPLLTRDRFVGADGFEKTTSGAVAPLSTDGGTVDCLIGCWIFERRSERRALPPGVWDYPVPPAGGPAPETGPERPGEAPSPGR
jgi:hypothetical protein